MKNKNSVAILALLATLTGAKTAEEIETINADAKSIFEKLSDELDSTVEANDALTKEFEKLSNTSAPAKKDESPVINLHEHSFVYESKKYGFNYPKLTINKQVVTPLEVSASTDLQKQLVESNSSMIKAL